MLGFEISVCEIPIAQLAQFIDGKTDSTQSGECGQPPHFRVVVGGPE